MNLVNDQPTHITANTLDLFISNETEPWLPPQTAKEPHIRSLSNVLLSFGHLLEF